MKNNSMSVRAQRTVRVLCRGPIHVEMVSSPAYD